MEKKLKEKAEKIYYVKRKALKILRPVKKDDNFPKGCHGRIIFKQLMNLQERKFNNSNVDGNNKKSSTPILLSKIYSSLQAYVLLTRGGICVVRPFFLSGA